MDKERLQQFIGRTVLSGLAGISLLGACSSKENQTSPPLTTATDQTSGYLPSGYLPKDLHIRPTSTPTRTDFSWTPPPDYTPIPPKYKPEYNSFSITGETDKYLLQICQTKSPDKFPETTNEFIWPVWGILTKWFGPYHQGLDIATDFGEPVKAADGGIVVGTYEWAWSFGRHVIIDHGTRLTLYAHLSEFSVQPGQRVQQGEEVGKIGSTGASTGPHLHFEVIQRTPEGCDWVNPWNLLPH